MIRINEFSSKPKENEFLIKTFNSEESALFWSSNRRVYDSAQKIINLLSQQMGNYKLFFCYEDNQIVGFYLIHSVSIANKRAEIMAYIDKNYRKGIYTFVSWVLILQELQDMGICRIFAKIFDINYPSLLTAQKMGFALCGMLPSYIMIDGKAHNAIIVSRTTEFNQLESYWHKKCCLR